MSRGNHLAQPRHRGCRTIPYHTRRVVFHGLPGKTMPGPSVERRGIRPASPRASETSLPGVPETRGMARRRDPEPIERPSFPTRTTPFPLPHPAGEPEHEHWPPPLLASNGNPVPAPMLSLFRVGSCPGRNESRKRSLRVTAPSVSVSKERSSFPGNVEGERERLPGKGETKGKSPARPRLATKTRPCYGLDMVRTQRAHLYGNTRMVVLGRIPMLGWHA
ncbi:hypothetical protein LY76DRAFT_236804 [Colletotrichum caudatum]|nr:hypothetical protein LY76DRAFT_236804 [Colletotrichum caudatum]